MKKKPVLYHFIPGILVGIGATILTVHWYSWKLWLILFLWSWWQRWEAKL